MQQTGNTLTGDYTSTNTETDTSTNTESSSHPANVQNYVEKTSTTFTTNETGNSITGAFADTITGTTSSTDAINGSNTFNYAVSETDNGAYTETKAGNNITGVYTDNKQSTDNYTMTETGLDSADDSFTLTETGQNTSTVASNGNTIHGTYAQTTARADTYTISETGITAGQDFAQTLTGSESYNTSQSGNSATGAFASAITGGGTYTLGGVNGSLTYSDTETGNIRAGYFNLVQTGTNRYALLTYFIDASDSGGGNDPGNMKFSPYGEAFMDPWVETGVDIGNGYEKGGFFNPWVMPVHGFIIVNGKGYGFFEKNTKAVGEGLWRDDDLDIYPIKDNPENGEIYSIKRPFYIDDSIYDPQKFKDAVIEYLNSPKNSGRYIAGFNDCFIARRDLLLYALAKSIKRDKMDSLERAFSRNPIRYNGISKGAYWSLDLEVSKRSLLLESEQK